MPGLFCESLGSLLWSAFFFTNGVTARVKLHYIVGITDILWLVHGYL